MNITQEVRAKLSKVEAASVDATLAMLGSARSFFAAEYAQARGQELMENNPTRHTRKGQDEFAATRKEYDTALAALEKSLRIQTEAIVANAQEDLGQALFSYSRRHGDAPDEPICILSAQDKKDAANALIEMGEKKHAAIKRAH